MPLFLRKEPFYGVLRSNSVCHTPRWSPSMLHAQMHLSNVRGDMVEEIFFVATTLHSICVRPQLSIVISQLSLLIQRTQSIMERQSTLIPFVTSFEISLHKDLWFRSISPRARWLPIALLNPLLELLFRSTYGV